MSMSNEQSKRGSWEHFLLRAAREVSLSEAQYEKINDRYSQLQKILNASDNPLLAEAHIFVQGSMRLKTTIKPVSGAPEDLDTIDADAIIWLPHAQGAGQSPDRARDTTPKRLDGPPGREGHKGHDQRVG